MSTAAARTFAIAAAREAESGEVEADCAIVYVGGVVVVVGRYS